MGQEALRGNWDAAKQACRNLDLQDSTDRAALELVLAVWAKERDLVAAAIAKMEGVGCRRLGRRQTARREGALARGRTSIRRKRCCSENLPSARAIR